MEFLNRYQYVLCVDLNISTARISKGFIDTRFMLRFQNDKTRINRFLADIGQLELA